ncbi:hypothetical protein FEM48_Zijuj12G0176500 [Ziziphus jujuba var. spinosa]|uniref:Uncharacterized protein n=1 Tax=Ziziphus jujuba var. spinosa TaxID=714518 RepID=A0A978UEQ0_ZIZJJ|nr:hypothetical protein FEM48_Zijuj12G0176500 [Ziziphus jujuba var. spinosa]
MDKTGIHPVSEGSCFERAVITFKRRNKSNPNDVAEVEGIISSRESKNHRTNSVNEGDRLSALNDNVLLHLLSFLPTLDAIRTCVLSKRWSYLWTFVPALSYNLERTSCCKNVDEFVSFVEKTIILNKSSKMFKFLLNFQQHFGECYMVHLDSKVLDIWTRFATKANVEELCLALYEDDFGLRCTMDYNLHMNYSLPKHIFGCSSLTKLYLSHCNIVPHGVITWTLLKSLSIKNTKVSDDVMQKVLSGSPALEVLEIRRCAGINRLDITSASVRKLVIEDYWIWNKDDISFIYPSSEILEILAPNIKVLELLGHFGTKCQLVDVSSLVSAHIGFELNKRLVAVPDSTRAAKYYKESQNMLRELLSSVRFVKELTLGAWCFQIITKLLEVKYLHSPLPECESLMLKARIREWELQGMAKLLRNFPPLVKLTIDAATCKRTQDLLDHFGAEVKISWASIGKTFNSLLLHDLKTVKIVGSCLCNEKQSIALAEFLLKNANVLETMVFTVSKKDCFLKYEEFGYPRCVPARYTTEDVLTIAGKLLSFPRSSPHANISFSWSML